MKNKKSFFDTFKATYMQQFKNSLEKRYPVYLKSLEDIYSCGLDVFLESTFEDLCIKLAGEIQNTDGYSDENAEKFAESIDKIFKWLPVYLVYVRSKALVNMLEQKHCNDDLFAKQAIENIKRNTRIGQRDVH